MSDKVKVKFLEACHVKDENNAITDSFDADKTYSLEPASAKRWVRRGKAEFTSEAEEAKAEAALVLAEASSKPLDVKAAKAEAAKIIEAAKAEAAKIVEAAKAEAAKAMMK